MEIFESTFQGGINADVNPKNQPQGTYRSAKNITITGLGDFFAAENILGSDVLAQITADSNITNTTKFNVLKMVDCIVEDRSTTPFTKRKAIALFLYYEDATTPTSVKSSSVYFISTEYDANNTTVLTFPISGTTVIDVTAAIKTNEGQNALDFPADGSVDCVVFGEKNYSNLYFTDYRNVPRKIVCILEQSGGNYIWNTSTTELSLLRKAPIDVIGFDQTAFPNSGVFMGGALPSGSYQLAYRYFNETKNKYSTFSLFTNPIPVYPQDYADFTNKEDIYGGLVNEATSKLVKVGIAHKAVNAKFYTHVQLCVVKNINGSKDIPLKAYLVPPVEITTPLIDSTQYYSYLGTEVETEIELKDVVVDTAPIKTVKTLETRSNILFGGNVIYQDRTTIPAATFNAEEVTKALGNNAIYQPTQANTDKGTITTTATQMSGGGFALVPSGVDVYVGLSGQKASLLTNQFFSLASSGNLEDCSGGTAPTTGYNLNGQPITLGGTYKVGNIITVNFQRMERMLAKGINVPAFDWQNKWWWNIAQNNRGNISNYGVATVISYTVTSENIQDIRDGLFQAIIDQAPVDYTIAKSGTDTILVTSVDALVEQQSNSDASCQPLAAGVIDIRPMTKVSWTIDYGQNTGIDTSKTGLGGYKNPLNTTLYKGYFREEMYRFARAYVDEYGNWSPPIPFNMTSATTPHPTKDWKFSNRKDRTILDNNDSVRALGLRLTMSGTGIHPTWARGMAVLRAKRERDIICQSPHIAAIGVQPNIKTITGVDEPEDGTFAPKKLLTGAARNLLRSDWSQTSDNQLYGYAIQNNTGALNGIIKGSIVYPPEFLFQYNGTSFYQNFPLNSLTIKAVDAITSFMTYQFITKTTGLDIGNKDLATIAVGFRSDTANTYYYYWNTVKTALKDLVGILDYFPPDIQATIISSYYALFGTTYPTLAEYPAGDNVKMAKIGKYNALEEVSLANKGNAANGQKSIFLTLNKLFGDLMLLNAKPVTGSLPTWLYNTLQFSATPDTYRHQYEFVTTTTDPAPPSTGAAYSDYIRSRYNETRWDNRVMNASDGTAFTAPVVNVLAGLPDDRYGALDDVLEYVFTGTYVPITSVNQSIDVEVWGGDCFVSKFNFKVADTSHGHFVSENINSDQDYTDAVTDNYVKAYPDMAEVVSCYIESEVNTELCADRLTYPVQRTYSLSNFSTLFSYNYNFGYSAQNYLKSWFTQDASQMARTDFPARIVISDQKVYNTNIEGFDTFRVAAYYDMDESYLGITKLVRDFKNAVYCIQERAVSDLLVGRRLLQDGDGNATVTYSTTLITEPQYILNTAGCQHIRSVTVSNESIFFADIRNRKVFKIGQGEISESGLVSVLYNLMQPNTIAEKDVFSAYDFNKKEYHLGLGFIPTTYIFSDRANFQWISEIVIDTNANNTKILGVCFSNKNLFIIGNYRLSTTYRFNIERMYANSTRGYMLGQGNNSYLEFVVNPEVPLEKIFDILMVDSLEKMDSISIDTYNPVSPYPQQTAGTLTIGSGATANYRQSMFYYPTLRDANGGRLRGNYAIVKITLNSSALNKAINKILTKFRRSYRNT